jgi:hypothetical protein
LNGDVFEWVVIEMIGVFSSDLVEWDRSIPLVDRFGGCGDLTHPALLFSSLPFSLRGYANETLRERRGGNLTVKAGFSSFVICEYRIEVGCLPY